MQNINYINNLSLHLLKTESILFGTKHMLSKHSKSTISCGNNVITSKTVIRYLGVDLEQTLSGTAIVKNILKKGNFCTDRQNIRTPDLENC